MFPFLNRFRFGQGQNTDPTRNMMRNVNFASEPEQEPYTNMQPQQEEDPTGFMSVYRDLMQRRNGPAMQAYAKYLQEEAPREEDVKPGKLTRLAAILSGAAAGFTNPGAGYQTAQSIIREPYQRRRRQYAEEGSRLAQAASLEESQNKSNIQNVKDIAGIQNQEADNKRQDVLASSLMKQRDLNMQRTQQLIEQGGAQFHLDKTTGTGYLVKMDGTKTPVGKFDQSTGEKLAEDINKMKTQSSLIAGREKARDSRTKDRELKLEDKRQENRLAMEDTRQSNRNELRDKSISASMERLEKRLNQSKDPSITAKIKSNHEKVFSIIDSDPDKYGEFWDENKNKLSEPPDVDSPEYADWVQLYNALYNGINQMNGKTTKSGNQIIR